MSLDRKDSLMTPTDSPEIATSWETPNITNRDNAALHPIGPIGHVDQVNGPGAIEVPEFVPTRHELMQLAKYWATEAIDLNFFMFVHQQTGSDWLRRMHFAYRRMNRIAECLGDAAADQVWEEAEQAFAKTVGARAWRLYREGGTPEEMSAFFRVMERGSLGSDPVG